MSVVHQKVLQKFLDGIHPGFTRTLLPWIIRHPRYLKAAFRLARSFRAAEKKRKSLRIRGLQVPSVMILSVTSKCNLMCSGCYAAAIRTTEFEISPSNENTRHSMNGQQWRKVVSEAQELGVFGFVIAGGEPFLCTGIVDLCMEFKDSFFLIVTNGTKIAESDFRKLRRASNIGIVVSTEGDQQITDMRRGQGVHKRTSSTLERLWRLGIFTGISVTVTRDNFDYWMEPKNLDTLVRNGIRLGVFIEYIPTDNQESRQSLSPCAEVGKVLTREEKERFRSHVLHYRENNPLILLHSPSDEEYFGGCVSAGRGFVHVTPSGDLTACPVSNLATHNLQSSSLREGLASPLFEKIRENEHILEIHDLPCALVSHKGEVMEIAKKVGAYSADTGEFV